MKLVQIEFVTRDISEIEADFILLKNSNQGMVGPEHKVNQVSGGMLSIYNEPGSTDIGSVKLLSQVKGIIAKNIILVGVGVGSQIRYETLRLMCDKVVETISRISPSTENATIATVSHGVGWGLDQKEVFKTQLFGFKKALEEAGNPELISKIVFGEINKIATDRQRAYLEELASLPDSSVIKKGEKYFLELGFRSSVANHFSSRLAESKYVFVAMPFAPEFENIYDFGLRLPIEQNNLLPVRTDKEFFVGSIMDEIKQRINDSAFIVADVTTLNPNVMFELGYAHGCQKPTIIISRSDQKLPFDVAGMNVIFYDPLLIRDLSKSLTNAIRKLLP